MSNDQVNISVTGVVNGFQTSLMSEVATAEAKERVKQLISTLQELNAKSSQSIKKFEENIQTATEIQELAKELTLEEAILSNYVAFKNGVVQITRASQLKITDALIMILFSMEKGYRNNSITIEQFENLISLNGIKFSYPMATAIFDLRKVGYLDTNLYEKERKLSLSPKGETNARRDFKELIEGSIAQRKPRKQKDTAKRKIKRKRS